MKGFEVIDNFLPEGIHKNITDNVLGGELPVFFHIHTLSDDHYNIRKYDELNEKLGIKYEGHSFFTHLFFHSWHTISEYDEIYKPIIEKINPAALMRVKLNMVNNVNRHISSGWHIDMGPTDTQHTTAIYHLNTNNGYTLFEDGTKVKSVANRLVSFPGNTLHTGITQTDADVRAFININYIK